jgi:hypothetical protein
LIVVWPFKELHNFVLFELHLGGRQSCRTFRQPFDLLAEITAIAIRSMEVAAVA